MGGADCEGGVCRMLPPLLSESNQHGCAMREVASKTHRKEIEDPRSKPDMLLNLGPSSGLQHIASRLQQ